MKVFFITYFYPPDKYPRSIQIGHLVQYLRKKLVLEVLTFYPDNVGDKSLLSFISHDNVQYAEKSFISKFIQKSRGDRIKKSIFIDFCYTWHFDLYKKISEQIDVSDTNVIVSFGQPMSVHLTGLKLKKKFPSIKWIAHFSDPWVDNLFNEYNVWTKYLNQRYQNSVFKRADRLVFTSQETIELVTKDYATEIYAKSSFVPHCFNPSLYSASSRHKDYFIIRYLGNFYGQRQPEVLFKALKEIPKRVLDDLRIELVGARVDLEQSVRAYGLEETVFICPSVSYLESLNLMQNSDLLLIIDAPAAISPFLPSKLVDYIGADKPIFGITPKGASQKLIEEMGFLVAHPNNTKEIAEKLHKMILGVSSGQLAPIPGYIRERYSVNTVGGEMAELLESIGQ